MDIRKILETKGKSVHSIHPAEPVSAAASMMAEKKVGALVVRDVSGKIVGMISERDIVRGMDQFADKVLDVKVIDLMTSNVVFGKLDDQIKDVMEVMTLRRIRHLPVMEGGELVGLVSIGDVVKYRIQEAQMELNVLRDYAIATR